MRVAERLHVLLYFLFPSVPRGELVIEILLLRGHDAAVCVGQFLGHSVTGVAGEPQMRIVTLDCSDHLCCGNGNGVFAEILGGPSVVARAIGHRDLRLLKLADVVGLRLEIMRVNIGRRQDRRDFHVNAAYLLGERSPLVDRGDHLDRRDLFGLGIGIGGSIIALRRGSSGACCRAERHAKRESCGKSA